MDRKTLIQQTVSTVSDAIMNLEMERDSIEYQLKEKRALLEIWKRELAALEKGKTEDRERAPKGEALRLIHEWYDKDPRAQQVGLTIKQIAQAIGGNWSTVRNVVKNPDNGFNESDDGRFRRSPEIDRQRRLKLVSSERIAPERARDTSGA